MRIAMFSDNFYPELSGISDSMRMTGEELARRGHTVRFYGPSHPAKNFALVGLPPRELPPEPNIDVRRVPSLPFPAPTGQGRLVLPLGWSRQSLREFKPDVVHVHDIFGLGLDGMRAARAIGVPVIGTNHTILEAFLAQVRWLPKRYGPYALRYNAWFYNQCAFVSAPSSQVFTEMRRYGFRAPHRVIPNPIFLDLFSPAARKAPFKKEFGFSKFTILFGGRLSPEKDIDVLIKAMPLILQKVPEAMLVIAGKGSQEPELRTLVRALHIDHAVKFLGFVDMRTTFPRIYKASDVFAMMSTSDSFSITMVQAMAAGLPVLAARSWGLVEYVHPDNGILIPPKDARTFANAAIRLATHPEEGRALGKGGVAYTKQFSVAAIADTWEHIYEHASKKRHRA